MEQNQNYRGALAGEDTGAITGPLSPQDAPPGWAPPVQPVGSPPSNLPPELRPTGQPPGQGSAYVEQGRDRDRQRRDRHYSRGFVGPLMLVLVGVLFLLNNFGIVDWSIWGELWRLWPLIPIAIGIELLIGRRNPILGGLILLTLLGVGIAFLFVGGGFHGGVKTLEASLKEPLPSGVKLAAARIDFGGGTLDIDAQARDAGDLASGTLQYYSGQAEPFHSVTRSNERVDLVLSQGSGKGLSFAPFGSKGSLNWDVHLNRQVPLDLTVRTGATEGTFDLEQLNITNLDLSLGASDVTINFPAAAQLTKATISGGATNLELVVPQGVAARITTSSGLSSVSVDEDRFPKNGSTYETRGYDQAPHKLDITLSVGAASVDVK